MNAADPVAFVADIQKPVAGLAAFSIRPLGMPRCLVGRSAVCCHQGLQSAVDVGSNLPACNEPSCGQAGFASDEQGACRLVQGRGNLLQCGHFFGRLQCQSYPSTKIGVVVAVSLLS